MSAEAIRGTVLRVVTETAAPVAMTIAVAAASPQRIRFTLPDLASWSWKKGEETVNQLGQKPAKTPEASPMRRMMMVISSIVGFSRMVSAYYFLVLPDLFTFITDRAGAGSGAVMIVM